jgi:hypothetical protein
MKLKGIFKSLEENSDICWYCYWGWPGAIVRIYRKALDKFNGNKEALHYGPAHIVWDDENFDEGSIKWCLKDIEDNTKVYNDFSSSDLEIVKESLKDLLCLPKALLHAEPGNYMGKHPELFPPPEGMEMVKMI